MDSKIRRYEKVKGQIGIRKDRLSGNYEAYKKIQGKRYSSTFVGIREARQWRLTFAPLDIKASDSRITIGELIELYKKDYLPTLATSTRLVRIDRIRVFDCLSKYEVEKITPEQITRFFITKVADAKASKSKRYNFDAEIRDLRAILNWYRETYNYKYAVPIIAKKLRSVGTLTKEKRIKQKLSADEFILFFDALNPFYQDVALVQSRIAGRISEVAGLQLTSLDFINRIIRVKDVVVYGRRKEFVELKPFPKSGDIRECFLTDDCLEVFQRRLKLKVPGCNYVFHINGKPLGYRAVQHAYDKALRDTGLISKTSGTHMIRHFTATLTRKVCGNLDSVQAVTGHKSFKLVQEYGAIANSLQGDSMIKVEEHLRLRRLPSG